MARNVTPYRSGGLLGGGGFDDLFSLHRDMNRLFDQAIGGGQGGGRSIINAHMDVSETEDAIRVAAELPGVGEDDIDVSLDDDVLTIRGEKRFERRDEKERHHFVERSYGTFQRSVRLPFPVDPEQVQASFENGVLTVTLPKTAAQDRTRRIQVQRGGAKLSAPSAPSEEESRPEAGAEGSSKSKGRSSAKSGSQD